MKQVLAGVALMSSLALSGSSGPAPESIPPPPFDVAAPISHVQEQEISQSFNAIRGYWSPQVVGMSAIRLVILKGTSKFTCEDRGRSVTVDAFNADAIAYCPSSDTVILSQAGINGLNYLGEQIQLPRKSTTSMAIAHELGHAVQDKTGQGITKPNMEEQLLEELQADCYGGMALKTIDQATAEQAPQFYMGIAGLLDPMHGSKEQRIGSFESGKASVDYSSC